VKIDVLRQYHLLFEDNPSECTKKGAKKFTIFAPFSRFNSDDHSGKFDIKQPGASDHAKLLTAQASDTYNHFHPYQIQMSNPCRKWHRIKSGKTRAKNYFPARHFCLLVITEQNDQTQEALSHQKNADTGF
jgi:hypothetical protein